MTTLPKYDPAFMRGLIAGTCVSMAGSAAHWLTFGGWGRDAAPGQVAVTIVIAVVAAVAGFGLVLSHSATEPRTQEPRNPEPNMNTNREERTWKSERPVHLKFLFLTG
jgi:hypothetical protein